MTGKVKGVVTLGLIFTSAWHVDAFTASRNSVDCALEAKVLREWLLVGDRYSSNAGTVEIVPKENSEHDARCAIVTTPTVSPGQVFFRLGKKTLWSNAYGDRDLGPKLNQARCTVGSLVPDPFVDKKADPPELWPTDEGLALVPLVDDLLFSAIDNIKEPNAVIGSPPQNHHGGEDDCLWCVATRRLDVGEQVVAADPWT